MRSQLRTFKITSNIRKPKPNKEKCKSISKAPKPSAIQDNSKTEQTPDSKCTQLLNNIKQYEYEYIKEFEKKITAEENGEDFDHSALERIGAELDCVHRCRHILKTVKNSTDRPPDTKTAHFLPAVKTVDFENGIVTGINLKQHV